MPVPLITLTTDFGLSDHYVGTMKGVILSICPRARIVDISHGIGAYEIAEGAFTLAQAYRYFPRRTVHVVVVDPGVGTARRPILVEAAKQYFVAPDNGVLSMICAREKHKARAITNERYFLKPVSQTFHGRDIFAPVGAHLAAGVAPARFGKLIADHLRQDFDKPVRTGRRAWTGAVLKVDRFGNMVTNFSAAEFPDLDLRAFEMAAGPRRISATARHYAAYGPGEPFLIVGSAGYYEISVSQGSAAKLLGCAAGAPLELTLF
ncbi:MAG TPA: SAM-dependent chlorinase/fluorinase [Bryobacteraceae bacterium]|nr:SAM-dependent chlorinase/fluorinase [Bryobacteraceae bacterium]